MLLKVKEEAVNHSVTTMTPSNLIIDQGFLKPPLITKLSLHKQSCVFIHILGVCGVCVECVCVWACAYYV